MIDSVTKHVLELQNLETQRLAESMVYTAHKFQETEDFQYYFQFIRDMKELLLHNGIFLREIEDLLEDLDRVNYNKNKVVQ